MAEETVMEVAAEQPVAETVDAAAAPAEKVPFDDSYDESLLIKVKGKVKKPVRPDDSERNLIVGKLQEEIDKASIRIKQIKEILDSRGKGPGASPEQQAIRERIAKLRMEFDTVLNQKKRLQSQNDDHKTQRDKLFTEQRAIKDTIRGPANLQAIEKLILELEEKLTHESLSVAQEKAVRERKERTERQDKPAVLRLTQVSAKIDECKAASEAIRAEITVLNEQLDKIKAARDAEEAKLAAVRAAEQEARSDIPALNVEKKELWEVITALRDKQREVRTQFQEKWDEFKKQDRAWKGWFAQERKKRQEQRKKEYEERQAARKANEMSHKPAKYEQEVYTCEQVLSYLRQFVHVEKATGAEEKKEVEAPAPGMKLLSKKGDAEEDALYSGMGGKKGKGARKAVEKAKKAVDSVKKLPQVLPLDTLKTFMTLGLDPPKTNEDVPASIAAVEAKKKEFEEKRDNAALEPSEEEEEEPAEEAEAAAEPEAAAEEAEEAAAEENGDKPAEKEIQWPKPAANGDAPKAEANGDAAVVAEANGNTAAAEEEEEAEANGDAAEPKAEEEDEGEEEASKAADGLGVKLRVTDDGEVNVELST